jgi:hypothetical protein
VRIVALCLSMIILLSGVWAALRLLPKITTTYNFGIML